RAAMTSNIFSSLENLKSQVCLLRASSCSASSRSSTSSLVTTEAPFLQHVENRLDLGFHLAGNETFLGRQISVHNLHASLGVLFGDTDEPHAGLARPSGS